MLVTVVLEKVNLGIVLVMVDVDVVVTRAGVLVEVKLKG